ncbi:MAG: HNH endonuclease [Sedimentisphaerales bacterium]
MSGIQRRVLDWLDRIFVWPVMMYRKWKYGYTFRRIYLGEGEYTIVDPDIYYKYRHIKWFLTGNKTNYYAACSVKNGLGETTTKRLHRIIMNAPDGLLVDHKNRKGLDNRIANLRLATHSENCCNREKMRHSTSQYKGVYCEKRRGREQWRANIRFNGKRIFLGYFNNEIDAAKAYDAAAKKYHRIFARLNFPEDADKHGLLSHTE